MTYEGFAAAWPTRDGEFADKFNTMPKYGSGKRLFGETSDKKPLRLVDSKTVGDGVVILVYAPAA